MSPRRRARGATPCPVDGPTWDLVMGHRGQGPLTMEELGECLRLVLWEGAARPRSLFAVLGRVGRADRRRLRAGWLGVIDRAVDPAAQAVARALEPVLRARIAAVGRQPVLAACAARLLVSLEAPPADGFLYEAARHGGTVVIGVVVGAARAAADAAQLYQAPPAPDQDRAWRAHARLAQALARGARPAPGVTLEGLLGWLTARLGPRATAVVAPSGAFALYCPVPARAQDDADPAGAGAAPPFGEAASAPDVLYALAHAAAPLAQPIWAETPTSALVLAPAWPWPPVPAPRATPAPVVH